MWNRREELNKRLNVERNHLLARLANDNFLSATIKPCCIHLLDKIRELIGIDISNELEVMLEAEEYNLQDGLVNTLKHLGIRKENSCRTEDV